MREAVGPGITGGVFTDYDAITNPDASVVPAQFMNDVSEELLGIQTEADIPQAPGTDLNVLKSILKLTKESSKYVGELFWLDEFKNTQVYNIANPIDDYFPAICLSTIASSVIIDVANWPQLVPHLRAKTLKYQAGLVSEVDNWSVTVAGSDITFPDIASANAMLASLVEDQLFAGGYTNWRTVNIDGSDFAITNIDLVTRIVTVTGAPTSGAQTARFYENRIAGSTTTARLYAANGLSLVGSGDSDSELVPGLRVRNRFQGHWHRIYRSATAGAGGASTEPSAISGAFDTDTAVTIPVTDGVNGTPRTGKTTRPDQIAGYLYIWGGRTV